MLYRTVPDCVLGNSQQGIDNREPDSPLDSNSAYIYTHICYIHILHMYVYAYIRISKYNQVPRVRAIRLAHITHGRTLGLKHTFSSRYAKMDVRIGFGAALCSSLHVSDVWEPL